MNHVLLTCNLSYAPLLECPSCLCANLIVLMSYNNNICTHSTLVYKLFQHIMYTESR